MPVRVKSALFGCGMILLLAAVAVAQQRARSPGKRAMPPDFDPAKAAEYFFEDVFAKLVGERPPSGRAPANVSASPTRVESLAAPAAVTTGSGWSRLVSSTTLEDEVKSIKQIVDRTITTPSDFAGRGHKVIRREFSILAMLFAIVAEYDGDIRFKRDAPAASALFARAARNAKAGGNTNVFNEAKLRKTDLEDLVGGSSLSAPGVVEPTNWGALVDRPPLMQRLEATFQIGLTPALASEAEFAKNSSTVLREAEMVAVMARVLAKEGMDDADDETYTGFADSMRNAAAEIVDAVKLKNYAQARAAAGKIDKACSQCHEAYR